MSTAYCDCHKGKYLKDRELQGKQMMPTDANSEDECIYCGNYVQWRGVSLFPKHQSKSYEVISDKRRTWKAYTNSVFTYDFYFGNYMGNEYSGGTL